MSRIRSYLKRDAEGASYRLVERTLEPPMFVLGLLFVPVLLGPTLAELSAEAIWAMELCGWLIWGAFAIEYFWLLYLAPDRREMVRTHKLDLIVVLVPFLRPLRFLRIVRLATAATGVGRAVAAFRRIGGRPGFLPFFASVVGIVVVGAGFALAFEHEQPGASIQNFGDAIWWSVVTCTTVGYGDHFPVTAGGQVVAVTLMIVGISALSVLTASVAALFVTQDDETEVADLRAQLDRIESLLTDRPLDLGDSAVVVSMAAPAQPADEIELAR